jgi:putative peptidoglycan lipid II flippase
MVDASSPNENSVKAATPAPRKNDIPGRKIGGAPLIAAGIFLSRIAGLVRSRVFAHYFGNSDWADAFNAAVKIPNFLQNLFGEGVLSASFIPVYANLVARGDKEEAGKVAGAVAALLGVAMSFLVLLGVVCTPFLIDLIAPGFHGEKRDLTIKLVQICFPGTGLLVMSAWCLGILNSHRRFFLSYVAPVISNLTMIATLFIFGGSWSQPNLAIALTWGLVLGSGLQLLVQLPTALRLVPELRIGLGLKIASVRVVVANFFPVVIARGVVQISAYIDNVLASLLPSGAVSALAYAQLLYLLPVSLFGMSVSAAELPAMSSAVGTPEEIALLLKGKLNQGLSQIAFFIVPTVVSFIGLGDIMIAAVFQSGQFGHEQTIYVWGVLAGSTIGLLAATLGRLYSSAFYALKDTRTPFRFAMIRVFLTGLLGYLVGLKFPEWVGISRSWGTAGLTASAGFAGWVEFLLLRRALNQRVGNTGLNAKSTLLLWASALIAVAVSTGLRFIVGGLHPILLAILILVPYGAIYLTLTYYFGIKESQAFVRRIRSRF